MKCIGLFKRLDSSTCVVITGTGTLNSGTQFPLKMLSYSISNHFKIFQLQHYYSHHACNCERVHHACAWLSEPTQTFPLANAAESHIYLKAVYKISTGRNMHLCRNVSKWQYFSIYFTNDAPRPS